MTRRFPILFGTALLVLSCRVPLAADPLSATSAAAFVGAFEWESDDGLVSVELSGELLFTRLLLITNAFDTGMSLVDWGFEGQDSDGGLEFAGHFSNDWYFASRPRETLSEMPWSPTYWEGTVQVSENLSGLDLAPARVEMQGQAWDFATNQFFLPELIVGRDFIDLATGSRGTLTLRIVPEPASVLAFAAGFAFVLAASRIRAGRRAGPRKLRSRSAG